MHTSPLPQTGRAALLLLALVLLSACQAALPGRTASPTAAPSAPAAPAAVSPPADNAVTVAPAVTAIPATVVPVVRTEPTVRAIPVESAVTRIPLAGPGAKQEAEISGMTWAGETLVLLPQFPARMAERPASALLTLSKQEILDFLEGKINGPLEPRPLALETGGLEKTIAGYEGFEAIAFHGRAAYLAVEASPGGKMKSYLVRGELSKDSSSLKLDPDSLVEVPLDLQIMNYSNEAIVIHGDRLLLFYEANGAAATREPRAHVYTLDLQEAGTLPLPYLEYRLTDATQPDTQGRFWVSNFFFPGDLFIIPSRDPLAEQYGRGPTHAAASVVERIVPMQISADGQVSIAAQPPLQIALADGQVPRNWEGLVRLDERGFLVATDKFPETILAFVPDIP